MKPILLSGPGLLLLLAATPVFSVTDTWDGGSGVNNNLNTNLNWVDNTAPVSDLLNTDLIFAGLVRLTPVVSVEFSTDSITFNNTAGAFSFSGLTLNVGANGIVNNDAQTMTFTNAIGFSGTINSTINAASGGLTFANQVRLPTFTLTVTGGFATSFKSFFGSTALLKQGAGTMTWSPNSTIDHDTTVSAGTVSTGADASTDVFSASALMAVNGTSTFNVNESLTLNGAQLTRAAGADINLAAGKTLTVQNGGDFTVTDAYVLDSASTLLITGAGSTLSTTSILNFGGGSTVSIASGGSSSSSSSQTQVGTAAGSSTLTVTGTGSSLGSGILAIGASGNTGSVTFSNSSTGTVTAIAVDNSSTAGTSATLNVQSGADLTGTSLQIAPMSVANTGVLTVTGSGSTVTLNGAATATIGAASASSGTLNVNSFAVFNGGTGLTTVNATGKISVMGGEYNSNGNFTLNGGQVTVDSAGDFDVAPGTTFTVQAGGVANMGDFFATNGSTFAVTGAGSTVSSTVGPGGACFRSITEAPPRSAMGPACNRAAVWGSPMGPAMAA